MKNSIALSFANDEVRSQWLSSPAPSNDDQLTKCETPTSGVRTVSSITHGFDGGVAYMYANSLERELSEDMAALRTEEDDLILSIRSLIADNL